jgi:hypothetical protein
VDSVDDMDAKLRKAFRDEFIKNQKSNLAFQSQQVNNEKQEEVTVEDELKLELDKKTEEIDSNFKEQSDVAIHS